MKTVMGSKKTVQRNWVVIDVKDKVLGRALMKKLKIYAGETHPHAAQKPAAMDAANA